MGKEPLPTSDPDLREQVEQWVETDPSLVPDAPSTLLVEPSVLDPAEVRALLSDLSALLAGATTGPVARPLLHVRGGSLFEPPDVETRLPAAFGPEEPCEEPPYEPHAA